LAPLAFGFLDQQTNISLSHINTTVIDLSAIVPTIRQILPIRGMIMNLKIAA